MWSGKYRGKLKVNQTYENSTTWCIWIVARTAWCWMSRGNVAMSMMWLVENRCCVTSAGARDRAKLNMLLGVQANTVCIRHRRRPCQGKKEMLMWMEQETSNGNWAVQPAGGKDYSDHCVRAFAKKGKSDERLFQDAASLFCIVRDRYTQGDSRSRWLGQRRWTLFSIESATTASYQAYEETETGRADARFEALELAVVSFQHRIMLVELAVVLSTTWCSAAAI